VEQSWKSSEPATADAAPRLASPPVANGFWVDYTFHSCYCFCTHHWNCSFSRPIWESTTKGAATAWRGNLQRCHRKQEHRRQQESARLPVGTFGGATPHWAKQLRKWRPLSEAPASGNKDSWLPLLMLRPCRCKQKQRSWVAHGVHNDVLEATSFVAAG